MASTVSTVSVPRRRGETVDGKRWIRHFKDRDSKKNLINLLKKLQKTCSRNSPKTSKAPEIQKPWYSALVSTIHLVSTILPDWVAACHVCTQGCCVPAGTVRLLGPADGSWSARLVTPPKSCQLLSQHTTRCCRRVLPLQVPRGHAARATTPFLLEGQPQVPHLLFKVIWQARHVCQQPQTSRRTSPTPADVTHAIT